MMKRLAIGSTAGSAMLASTPQSLQVRSSLNMYRPKQDVQLGEYNVEREFHNFNSLYGRTPDYDLKKYRKAFFRMDELFRRVENRVRKQGFFYMPMLDFHLYRGITPLFSQRQLFLHYDKHHRAYVNKLNSLIAGTRFFGRDLDDIILGTKGDAENVAIYNNAAQHFNHSFFWKTIQPGGSICPPDMEAALAEQYGSLAEFEQAFINAALGHFGSGWIYLVYDSEARQFDILSLANAAEPISLGVAPLLACDVWEHAYYKDYENDRAKYMSKFFKCVDYHWAERHWKRVTGQDFHEMAWV